MSFFHTLALKADLSAHEDPARWQTLEDFQLDKKYANSLPEVNDWAERAEKLAQDFNIQMQLVKNRNRIGCFSPKSQSKVPRSQKVSACDDIRMY